MQILEYTSLIYRLEKGLREDIVEFTCSKDKVTLRKSMHKITQARQH